MHKQHGRENNTLNPVPAEYHAKLIKSSGVICMVAAMLSCIHGLWEVSRPIFISREALLVPPSSQLWGYAILAVFKSAGFLCGVVGLLLVATHRGVVLKIVIVLAVAGAGLYAVSWLVIAATGRDVAFHILRFQIGGTDQFSNGAVLYQAIAPVAVGIAALRTARVSRRLAVWAIIVGVVDLQVFAILRPGVALLVQGILWWVFGYGLSSSRDSI
jgi:hypothetical protein